MVALELFTPYIAAGVLGCPEPLMLQVVRSVCADFCRRTDVVQRINTPANIVSGQQDYPVTPPSEMRLARIMGVAWQGVWLVPIPPDAVESDVVLRGADVGSAKVKLGEPRYYFQKTHDSAAVSLYPVPESSVAGGLLIKASFCPTVSALNVDDTLLDEWAEGIAAGALARLYAIPGQSFSSASLSPRAQYEFAVGVAKRQVLVGKMTSGARVQPRRFA